MVLGRVVITSACESFPSLLERVSKKAPERPILSGIFDQLTTLATKAKKAREITQWVLRGQRWQQEIFSKREGWDYSG